jgi:hypothetical protein
MNPIASNTRSAGITRSVPGTSFGPYRPSGDFTHSTSTNSSSCTFRFSSARNRFVITE